MMTTELIADFIVLLHLAFILFATLGGLLVLRWPRLIWLHLPCLLWAVLIEVTGAVCPLTPLEIHFRHAANQPGYTGDFITRYLVPLIYPPGLTRNLQLALGALLLLLNLGLYTMIGYRLRQQRRRH